MSTFYLKNTSGSTVTINDLGISIPDGMSIQIDSNAINGYLTSGLVSALTGESLILSTTDIGNSGGDLTSGNAIKALTITSEYDTDNPHEVTLFSSLSRNPLFS